MAANGTDSKTISITKTGNLTLTLSSNSGLVLLYLTGTGCTTTDPFLVSFAGSCAFIGTANAAFTQVTTAVQSGQSYKFWVDSFDGAASHAWTVTLSVPN